MSPELSNTRKKVWNLENSGKLQITKQKHTKKANKCNDVSEQSERIADVIHASKKALMAWLVWREIFFSTEALLHDAQHGAPLRQRLFFSLQNHFEKGN